MPLKDGSGTICGLCGISTDITERRQAQEAPKESEIRFSMIFANDPSGIILVNGRTRSIHDANPTALALIGLPKEKLVGKTCHGFLCPAEVGRCPICDIGQEVDRSERVLIRADGERLPILKTVIPIKLNGEEYLLENFIDISRHKKAEEEAARERSRLQTLSDNAPFGMALMV